MTSMSPMRDAPHTVREKTPRTLGIKLIIAYKFVKAPLMLALALWLAFDAEAAYRVGQRFAAELYEGGTLLFRLGRWIHQHLTTRTLHEGAVIAGLDGVTTALEGTLLWLGKAWGEWLVILGLALLLPFEANTLIHHPNAGKAAALLINAAIVGYLIRRRLSAARKHAAARPEQTSSG